MPNKTIYIREADEELWEEAEKMAGGSVSGLIADALRRYVEEKRLKEKTGMETIEINIAGHEEWGWEETLYDAQFVGRWLLEPDPDETRTGEPGYDAGAYYGVALTRRGNIAVYSCHVNDAFAPQLKTYLSLEDAEENGVPGDIVARAGAVIGSGYVRKLDI